MDSIEVLISQPVIKVGRNSNLCWMLFGKSIIEKDIFEKEVKKGEYSLHMQCPWKIIDTTDYVIKLASGDIYQPNSNIEWNENFDWDIQGNNLFDEKIKDLFKEENQVYVKNITVSQNGDFKMLFSNMLMLESFVDVSTDQECWRFFKHGEKKHLVINGNGREFQ